MKAPPHWALRFFRWFCDPLCAEDIEGDLLERFEKRTNENKSAGWLFVLDVIKLFRPGIIKPITGSQKLNYFGMINNYFKVGLRSILRQKVFSSLNVSGLAVGIASCILILIYVKNELSYDTYNTKYDRIYRVLHYFGTEEFDPEKRFPISEHQVWGNAPVGPELKDYYPEIENMFRFSSPKAWLLEYGSVRFQEKNIVFADSNAFEVFDWKLIGDPKTCLIGPNSIVISSEMAKKVFGDEDPMGKTLMMDAEDPMQVTGVYEIPSNSHISFDAMMSMSTFRNFREQIFEAWGYVDFYSYFTINENASIDAMTEKIPEFIKHAEVKGYTISFEPLSKAYLNSEAGRQPGPVGNKNNIYLFVSVAIFVLIIASINFMNLSTARSVERAKEVAIRKTIGSHRAALILQFLVESVLLTFLAGIIGVALVIFGHHYLEILVDKTLPIEWLFEPSAVLLFIGTMLILGIITGSYPAFILSKFKPTKVLKGSFKSSSEGIWLRKSLVVLQFSLSIILLVGTLVVYNQLQFLKDHEKGFDSEQVLVIDYAWDARVQRNIATVKEAFAQHSAVASASASRATPGEFFPNGSTGIPDPTTGELVFNDPAIYEVDEDFIPTYDMEIVAGRNYSKEFPTDSTSSLVINAACAKLFGYPNPEDIIGKKFSQWGREGVVIGVVSDFNYVSLHNSVEPLALRYSTKWSTSRLSLKLKSKDYSRSLAELEELWNDVVPYHPFVAYFNDTNFNEQYETDQRFGNVFSVFSGFAVFVACLGLFGLTIYSTTQRSKEIGVRKVLGASVPRLVSLLTVDFVKLFLVSLIISIPISWYVMSRWLESFAYQVSIDWKIFVLASCITLLVAIITMSFKTISAALANPVESLRDE